MRWAGSYTFISCSHYGWEYYNAVRDIFGTGFKSTVFVHKEGTASCYMPKNELQRIANEVAANFFADRNFAKSCLGKVVSLTDEIMPLMTEQTEAPVWEEYKKFLDLFDEYLAYHVFMKELIDFYPKGTIDGFEKEFLNAREYSTPIYSQSEVYFRSVMKAVGKREGINADLLTCLSRNEFERYLRNGDMPNADILKERFDYGAIVYLNEAENILTGEDAEKVDEIVAQAKDVSELKGMVAYKGKVQGICRIVPDPFKHEHFQDGDILITGMTRPEFLPVMKKASAFVTDAGGMLCHAAIAAREMKKPCIIGTEVATKVFKDGDLIEVDAEKGIIRKI